MPERGSGFFFQSEFFFREIAFKYKKFVQRIAEQDLDIKNAILQQTKELGFAIGCIPAFLQYTVC